MPLYGRYETVRELSTHARGSVHTARLTGTESVKWVIRTFRPSPDQGDARQAALEAELFLEQARLQQVVGDVPDSAWAPIHDIQAAKKGAQAGEFYTVSDLFERSAGQLIDSRVKLTSNQLHRIISAVITGLRQLRERFARAHGNLKPTNVLMTSSDLETARALLADPVADRRLSKSHTEAADLVAVGRLLFSLVTHREPTRDDTLSSQTEEWTRFGRKGAAWKELCAKLLKAADTEPPLTLEQAATETDKLKPRSKVPWPVWAVPATAVLVILTWVIWPKEPPQIIPNTVEREQWVRAWVEHYTWFEGLAKPEAPTDQSAALDAAFQELIRAAQTSPAQNPWKFFHVDGPRDRMPCRPTVPELHLIQQALTEYDGTRTKLSELPVRKEIEAFIDTCAKVGWSKPGGYARGLLLRASPPDPAEIDRVATRLVDGCNQTAAGTANASTATLEDACKSIRLDLRAAIQDLQTERARINTIAGNWNTIQTQLAVLEKSSDTVLRGYPAFVASHTASQGDHGAAADMDELGTRLQQQAERATALAKLAVRLIEPGDASPFDPRQIDHQAFREGELYKSLVPNPVNDDGYRALLAEAEKTERYQRLDPALDPRTKWVAETSLAELDKQIDLLATVPDDAIDNQLRTDFTQSYERIVAARAALVDPQNLKSPAGLWCVVNKTSIQAGAAAFEKDVTSHQNRVEGKLAQIFIDVQEFKAELARKEPVTPSKSPALEERFSTERDRLTVAADANTEKINLFRLKQLQVKLRGIDAVFAIPSLNPDQTIAWSKPVDEAVKRWRDEFLKNVLVHTDLLNLKSPDSAEFQSSFATDTTAYDTWTKSAQAVVDYCRAIEQLLSVPFGLNDSPPSPIKSIQDLFTSLKTEAAYANLQTAVTPITDRVRQLIDINASNDSTQLTTTAERGSPALTLAAWRRLGELNWPATLPELQTEHAIYTERLKPIIDASISQPVHQQKLRDEVRQQSPARWNRAFATLAKKDDIGQALALLPEGYSIDSSVPASRYKATLYQLDRNLESKKPFLSDEQCSQFLDQFHANTQQLTNVSLAIDLRNLIQTERANTNTGPDLASIGPGSIKLQGKPAWTIENKTETSVTYQWQAAANKTHRLTFALVEPRDDKGQELQACFLCTTEFTLGLFMDWLNATASWPAAQSMIEDTWIGPRAWTWRTENRNKRLDRNPIWLLEKSNLWDKDYYPQTIGSGTAVNPEHGGNPSFEHPIQFIPPHAAAFVARQLGCRLPTATEWKTALGPQATNADNTRIIQDFKPNIRDQTFQEQVNWVDTVRKTKQARQDQEAAAAGVGSPPILTPFPDAGSYSNTGSTTAPTSIAPNYNDNILWFDIVNPDRTTDAANFKHLVGNVAEYVCNTPATIEDLDPAAANWQNVIMARLTSGGTKVSIVGGSALSDPANSFATEIDVQRVGRTLPAYADVGFRLAFKGSRTLSLAQRIRTILDSKDWYAINVTAESSN